MTFTAEPVAHVESARSEPIDDDWSNVEQTIVLDESFDESALAGIEDFSHLEVVYFLHRVDPDDIERGARHPRGNPDWPKVGIFAQRAKDRPNRIGVTTCRLVKRDGRRLQVVDLDCIDGTPVLDIKPFVREFLPRGAYRQADWVGELMLEYWKVHGHPHESPVDYEGLKAAFSVLPKPQWVYGDSFEIDTDEVGVQRLVDSNPDTLKASDFWGYVDTCVPGCMEDMRYLLPPLLRIWEQSINQVDDAFAYHFHNKLLQLGLFKKNLHGPLEPAVTSFMRRALSERIARESSLEVKGRQATHDWVGNFNAFGAFTYSFPQLWEEVWAAEQRGHAVAVLQYISALVFDEGDNPIFAEWQRKGGGGPLSVRSVNFDQEGAAWLEGNMEFLAQRLHVEYLLERLAAIEQRYARDEVAAMSAQIRDGIAERRDVVAQRCRALPGAFTASAIADEDSLDVSSVGNVELRYRLKHFDETCAAYSRLFMQIPKYEMVEQKRALVLHHGTTRLVFIDDPDHDWAGTGAPQTCLEVMSVQLKVMEVQGAEGLEVGGVHQLPGRDELHIKAPELGPLIFFSRG